MRPSAHEHQWTIILAGGDGVRLRQLTRALHGEELPKQFALIHGSQSLLQCTVNRALRWTAAERVLVVVASEREALAREQVRQFGPVDVVAQPCNQGTGPGILLPIARILARDPLAQIVILPSDHYVRDERAFESSIRRGVAAAASGQIALLGAVPDHPETQYGWIVGEASGAKPAVVARFCEKPSMTLAEQLFVQGALWNTFIMAGSVQQFWALCGRHLPGTQALFDTYRSVVGAQNEASVLREIYANIAASDFSRDVLQKATGLYVVPLADCGWSDWGTPERVLDSLRHHSDFSLLLQRLAMAAAC